MHTGEKVHHHYNHDQVQGGVEVVAKNLCDVESAGIKQKFPEKSSPQQNHLHPEAQKSPGPY